MKLNLPSTWTSKKILTLFLAAFLQVKGGSDFNKCLGDTTYQAISIWPANTGKTNYAWSFCCFNGTCGWLPCSSRPFADISFQCVSIGQSTFCVTTGSSATGAFGGLCGGIIGDVSATNATVVGNAECPSLEIVARVLKSDPTTNSTFSWLCCDVRASNPICWVPTSVTVNNGWATMIGCDHPYNGLMCFFDNGGWTCIGGHSFPAVVNKRIISSIYLGVGQIFLQGENSSCALQLGGIGSSKNVLPVSSISVSNNPTEASTATKTVTVTETVRVKEGNLAWVTALVGIVSSLGTILLAIGIRLLWTLVHASPSFQVAGSQ